MASGFSSVRDLLFFAVGIYIIVTELSANGPPDYGTLVFGASVAGLPAFLPLKDPPPSDPPKGRLGGGS